MIEIIYNESGKTDGSVIVKPPKNIRQIGTPRGRHKIYVEDYVYTFLHSAAFEGECQKRAAVLLGKSEISQDIRYTFISGAVSCEDFVFQEDGIVFDEGSWEYIYKEIKQYFDNQEIVGWFLGMAGFPLELTPVVEAAHRKYFAGRDKVLFLSEPAEREDVFFAYEQGILQRKEGYYIYYEKNLPMQEYMVCTREKNRESGGGIEMLDVKEEIPALEGAEQAIWNYRNELLERKEAPGQKKMSLLLYTAASAAMVILCVIGITTVNNYEKMMQVQETLAAISEAPAQEETTDEAETIDETEPTGVVVESVPGEVEPQSPDADTEPQSPDTDTEPQSPDADTEPQSPDADTESQSPDTDPEPQSSDADSEGAAEGTEDAAEAAVSAKIYLEQGYYQVQPGDKLELICKKIYQTTAMMDKLCEANQIEDVDKIYTGQKLVLP